VKEAGFLTSLQVEQVDDDDWRLISPLNYWSALKSLFYEVPKGFVTDFASVPRLPFIYWFMGGKAEAPAVLHDWMYRTGSEGVSRADADAILYEAVKSAGYWRARAWLMWAGVRIGGYWSFESRSIHTTER
jgi:hypothetical protein